MFSYTLEEDQRILDTELQWVRTNFFPNWDLSGEWTIKSFWQHNEILAGVSFSERKIYIHNHLLWRDDIKLSHPTFLKTLIIHEVAHAVLPKRFSSHGRQWLEILVDCSVRAEQLGMRDLANELLEEFFEFWWNNGRILSTKGFYAKARQMLLENPDCSLSRIADDIFEIIDACGIVPNSYDEKIYKICQEAYDVAQGKKIRSKRYFFIKSQLAA